MAPLCNVMVRCLGFPAQFVFGLPLFWLTPDRSRKAPMLCGYLGTRSNLQGSGTCLQSFSYCGLVLLLHSWLFPPPVVDEDCPRGQREQSPGAGALFSR